MNAPVHDCVGALLVRDGFILLGRRRDDCDWLAGAWDVFGGHVEPGESGPGALHRELREELGIAPLSMCYVACIEGDGPDPWRLRLYQVTRWHGQPVNRAEHAEIRWCTLHEAGERLRGAHPRFPELLSLALGSARELERP